MILDLMEATCRAATSNMSFSICNRPPDRIASRNGRHPQEADAVVVHLLYGLAIAPEQLPTREPLKDKFPYFPISPVLR